MPKKAFQSFSFQGANGIIVVSEDDLYAEDHPYVLAMPHMFGEHADMVRVHQAPKVEKATAAPGETRNVSKPK